MDVAVDRPGQVAALGQPVAIGGQAPAELAHHPPDMLADDEIADATLAQLAVHVGDEAFGETRRILARIERIEPEQHQRQHAGDHVEAAVERVRHRAVAIPAGAARLGDHRVVKRVPCIRVGP